MQINGSDNKNKIGFSKNIENRVNDIRRDVDDQKNISISLETVDSTILNYLKDYISPTIVDANDVKVKVPVIYGTPERWKSATVDGFFRDQTGKIQKPVIMIKRTDFSPNPQLASLNRHLSYQFQKKYSNKNRFNQYNVLTGKYQKNPVFEVYNVTVPDHIVVNYECIIWTDKVYQLNDIQQKLIFSENDYWGTSNGPRFKVKIENFSGEISTSDGQDRTVKSSFTISANAYLLPETFENGKSTTQKSFSPRKIMFDTEFENEKKNKNVERTDSIFIDPNKNRKSEL